MNMHSRSMATDEVHRFLVALFGRNQRAFLVAIPPDQKPRPGQWMNLETDEQLKAFLAANRDANIYYQVQIVDDGFGGIKASAADIVGLHAIHVDLDPPKEGGSIEEAKRVFDAVVEKLKEAGCAPSAVVDSGGGYQLVWSIETVPADEGGKTAIETANDEIAIALGGDAAAKDIARLLRLPGTINHPDKRKRARGRIEAPATLLELPGGLHEIDRVVETVRLVGAELGLTRPAAVATSKQPSTEEYAQARKYLRKHPNALPKALETRLEEAQLHSQRLRCRWRGNADGLHDTSRSAMDMSVASILANEGFSIEEIALVLRNSFEHGKGEEGTDKYFIHTAASAVSTLEAREGADLRQRIEELNAEYFVAPIGGKTMVCRIRDGQLEAMSPSSFRDLYANEFYKVGTDWIPLGTIWFTASNPVQVPSTYGKTPSP